MRVEELQEAKDYLIIEMADMLDVPLFTAEALLRKHGTPSPRPALPCHAARALCANECALLSISARSLTCIFTADLAYLSLSCFLLLLRTYSVQCFSVQLSSFINHIHNGYTKYGTRSRAVLSIHKYSIISVVWCAEWSREELLEHWFTDPAGTCQSANVLPPQRLLERATATAWALTAPPSSTPPQHMFFSPALVPDDPAPAPSSASATLAHSASTCGVGASASSSSTAAACACACAASAPTSAASTPSQALSPSASAAQIEAAAATAACDPPSAPRAEADAQPLRTARGAQADASASSTPEPQGVHPAASRSLELVAAAAVTAAACDAKSSEEAAGGQSVPTDSTLPDSVDVPIVCYAMASPSRVSIA